MGLKEELQSISADELARTLWELRGRLRGQEMTDSIDGLTDDLPNFTNFIITVDKETKEELGGPESIGDVTAGVVLSLLVLREIAVKRALQESLEA